MIEAFDCGVPSLDVWLNRRARSNQASGASRTYVVADHNRLVIAYYALSSGALAVSEARGSVRRNMPDPIPVAVLGRLAVDKTYQGQGLGVALLQDAVIRVRQAADILGMRGIIVHALSEEAKRFYQRYGFVEGINAPMMLVLSLK